MVRSFYNPIQTQCLDMSLTNHIEGTILYNMGTNDGILSGYLQTHTTLFHIPSISTKHTEHFCM